MTQTAFGAASLRPDIEYSHPGEFSLQMDARIPQGAGPFPAVVIVHGGGWVRGDRKTDVTPLFRPLEDAGFASFSINYRLAKDITQFGAGILDVEEAVRYVKRHAAEFRIDPSRIALVGESAGAQLASMAALNPELGVRAVVALYSPSDLVSLAKTSQYVPENIRRQVQGTPWESFILAGLEQLSPIHHVHSGMPPFLLIHGTADSLVPYSQSERMCEAIHAAGGQCELIPVKGGGHGMRWWESERLTAYKPTMVRWLQRQLAAGGAGLRLAG